MKRFASFLLAFVLVFSMAIPAFATENPQVQRRFKHIISFGTSITYKNTDPRPRDAYIDVSLERRP